MSKKQKIIYYILLVMISALFLFSGVPKLLAEPIAVKSFTIAGLPLWFMYLIGIGEILGAIGLWIPRVFRYAYEGLFIVLAGATGVTIAYVGLLMALFPILVAVMLGIVVWLHSKTA
jgi:putative oxidoreductase